MLDKRIDLLGHHPQPGATIRHDQLKILALQPANLTA
jgi:hypothetical protein